MPMVFCRGCGKEIHDSAISCPQCGAMQVYQPQAQAIQAMPGQAVQPAQYYGATDKRILPAFLLCFFVGYLGIHRFYVGKIGSGIAMLLTFGGLGVWWLIDLIIIVCGAFTDDQGRKITLWT